MPPGACVPAAPAEAAAPGEAAPSLEPHAPSKAQAETSIVPKTPLPQALIWAVYVATRGSCECAAIPRSIPTRKAIASLDPRASARLA